MKIRHIGHKVSTIRQSKGISVNELSNKTGIRSSDIIKIENRQKAISLDEGVNISKGLDIDFNSLLRYNKSREE